MRSSERHVHVDVAVRSWRRAQLAAIAWRAPDGTPDAASVIPLAHGARPCLALTYAELGLARALEASTELILAVLVPSPAGDDPPVRVRGRAEVMDDPEGTAFHDRGLLDMELAKHPPSRRRLDSLLVRREHWWFVPRLLVDIGGLGDARTVPPADALLVTGGPDLDAGPCHLEQRTPLVLRADGRESGRRPAVILEHGADLPDMERPWERRWRGTLDGDRFETDTLTGERPRPDPLTLRERIRAERQLERACRAGLREAGHA